MAGTGITLYATTASGNKIAFASGIDWRENVYMPSQVNDNIAQIMADIRALANNIGAGFVEVGDSDGTYTATYVSATQFRIDGADVSTLYTVGRRVRAVAATPGTINGTITAVSYSAPNTTVTVAWDSGSLANEAITSIMIGIGSGLGSVPAAVATQSPVYTACRLNYVNTTTIRLDRHNGFLLTIDNTPQQIPAAGVTLGRYGAPSTLYYVYACMIAGVMTLEPSTTGYAADSRNGVMVKSGDVTRTLVGMIWIDAGAFYISTATVAGVRSYFNRHPVQTYQYANTSTSSASPSALMTAHTSLVWPDDIVTVIASGYMTNNVINGTSWIELYADYASTSVTGVAHAYINGATSPVTVTRGFVGYTAGLHAWHPAGWVGGGGTGNYVFTFVVVVSGPN